MEVRIEKKEAFTAIGVTRAFSMRDCYDKIPKYWSEIMGKENSPVGIFGISYNCGNEDGFDYMIADLYQPWAAVREDQETIFFDEQFWAVFPCYGKIPEDLQALNTSIWRDWVPAQNEYAVNGDYSIEMYAPMENNSETQYVEIWIPVRKIG